MRYELYTLPNCSKCEKAENVLSKLNGEVFSLVTTDGLNKLRSYMSEIRKDLKRDKGAYVLPIVLFFDDSKIKVVQGLEVLVEWISKQ